MKKLNIDSELLRYDLIPGWCLYAHPDVVRATDPDVWEDFLEGRREKARRIAAGKEVYVRAKMTSGERFY